MRNAPAVLLFHALTVLVLMMVSLLPVAIVNADVVAMEQSEKKSIELADITTQKQTEELIIKIAGTKGLISQLNEEIAKTEAKIAELIIETAELIIETGELVRESQATKIKSHIDDIKRYVVDIKADIAQIKAEIVWRRKHGVELKRQRAILEINIDKLMDEVEKIAMQREIS